MKICYPIVMEEIGERGYVVVYVPDLKINTQGRDFNDAMLMARDAIELILLDIVDDGDEIPGATPVREVMQLYKGRRVEVIEVDTTNLAQICPNQQLTQQNKNFVAFEREV